MSPISRRSLIAVLLVTAVLTSVIAVPLQAAVFQSNVTPTVQPTVAPSVCSGFYYRVQSGDTLYRIATRYGVTVSRLVSCNGLANANRIFAGQLLLIPGSSGPVVPPPSTCGGTYRVVFGDTLYSIARRYGTTAWAIASLNGISNINFIWAGQVLRIPCGTGTTPPPSTAGWYKVQSGDSVSRIAARFGTSIWSIINANGLRYPYTIYIGQWLRIP